MTLQATPSAINAGGSATLTWSATHATICESDGWTTETTTSGSEVVSPTTTTTYGHTCTGPGGSVTDSVTVTVSHDRPGVTFTASPTSIVSGGSSTLTWTSSNATSCASDGWTSSTATSGTTVVSPASTKTYGLTCTGQGGSTTRSATVTVSASAPTATLTASPSSITAGASSTLTWSSTNAGSCVSDGWTSSTATAGSAVVSPTTTTVYGLTCTGSGGSAADSAIVTVSASAPTATLTASPSSINAGDSATLTWSSTNATSCTSDGWTSSTATSGSEVVSPGSTTTYGVTCTGPGGSANENATVTVQAGAYYPAPEASGGWRRLVAINATPTAAEKANILAVTGIDWDLLKVARDYSEALASSSVLVIRNGWVAGEWGVTGRNKVASVTKSLVGLAMARLMDMSDAGQLGQTIGLQSLAHQHLPAAFGASDPLKQQIRIEHLMTMSSGIREADPDFLTEQERLTYPMDWAPGTHWVYSSLPPNLLSMILQGLAGQSLGNFFNTQIASAVGASALSWETIDGGYTRGAHGARVSPRDLARLAYLTLNDGVWDDGSGPAQVISSSRVNMLTAPAPVLVGTTFQASAGSPFPLPADAPNHYGHLFWTNATQVALGTSVPTDAYYMHGCRDNLVVVVPSKDLIVVRTSTQGPCTQTTFRSEFMQRVMAAVTN